MMSGTENDFRLVGEVFDVERICVLFPIFAQQFGDQLFVYFDNVVTMQKLLLVLNTLLCYYVEENVNIYWGVYGLSQWATDVYEGVRVKMVCFLNVVEPVEVVFIRNVMEGINFVVQIFGWQRVMVGDEVVISVMEYHLNIVLWQLLCEEKGAQFRVVFIFDSGELMFDELVFMFGFWTKVVLIVYMSNLFGIINLV